MINGQKLFIGFTSFEVIIARLKAECNMRAGGGIMPREKECYRQHLERLDEKFPNRELLTQLEVAKYTGLCRQTVKKRYPFDKNTKRISKVVLARELS